MINIRRVWPSDNSLTLHSNHALWRPVNSREYDFVLNGHTHSRLVASFDHLTIINAGTLFREHNPCCCIVDFEACVVQYFNLPGRGRVEEAEKFPLPNVPFFR